MKTYTAVINFWRAPKLPACSPNDPAAQGPSIPFAESGEREWERERESLLSHYQLSASVLTAAFCFSCWHLWKKRKDKKRKTMRLAAAFTFAQLLQPVSHFRRRKKSLKSEPRKKKNAYVIWAKSCCLHHDRLLLFANENKAKKKEKKKKDNS